MILAVFVIFTVFKRKNLPKELSYGTITELFRDYDIIFKIER